MLQQLARVVHIDIEMPDPVGNIGHAQLLDIEFGIIDQGALLIQHLSFQHDIFESRQTRNDHIYFDESVFFFRDIDRLFIIQKKGILALVVLGTDAVESPVEQGIRIGLKIMDKMREDGIRNLYRSIYRHRADRPVRLIC